MSDYVAGAASAVVTLAITKGLPWVAKAYERRYVDPKRAHQQVLLKQADWYEERAEKLAAFRWELGFQPPRDKFNLAHRVSRLDPKDQEWAMKETDIELLGDWAARKGAECRENSSACARQAEEINYRTFVFPLA